MADAGSHARSVVILGATSAIARALAERFAREGYAVVVAARDQEENEAIAADLRVRYGIPAHAIRFDALAYDEHAQFVTDCEAALGHMPEGLVLCFGYLAEQKDCQDDFAAAKMTIDANYTGAVSILEQFATPFEARKHGFMGVITSIAGDRGRQDNYCYGSAKAATTVFAQGLRNRLCKSNVHVTTIKPGYVDTKMTYGKPLPGPLVASAEKAASDIYRAITKKKNIVYVPIFWQLIMLIIKSIPEWQFKKMKI